MTDSAAAIVAGPIVEALRPIIIRRRRGDSGSRCNVWSRVA
jgi:hypothetical protein